MAKSSLLERNLKRKQMIEKFADKRAALKKMIKDPALSLSDRFLAAQKLDKLPVDGSSVRYRNRCAITGRGRGLAHKSLGISRIELRRLVGQGYIPGIRKASW
jgi:small subunit ribosomal protein S14